MNDQHTNLISQFSGARLGSAAGNVDVIRDIADAIHTVPPVIDRKYLEKCQRAASYLKNVSNLEGRGTLSKPIVPEDDSNDHLRNLVFAARNSVFDAVAEFDEILPSINLFIPNAAPAIENPFAQISLLNAQRIGQEPINISDDEAADLVDSLGIFLTAVDSKNAQGFSDQDLAHLSSVSISFEGFGGSGDSSLDLIQFVPDTTQVAQQKFDESLSIGDFSLRIPKIVFVIDYSPDGQLRGSIVAWRKVPDAAGYIVKRRNIFDGNEQTYTLTNENVQSSYVAIKEYVTTWALGFYDSLPDDSVYAWLDPGIASNAYYSYTVQAYQITNPAPGSIFSVETVASNLSSVQRLEVQRRLGSGESNPYPIVAEILLGNGNYDWILAGINIKQSIDRNDSQINRLGFSFLTTDLQFIFGMMDAGKFFVPKNVGDVIKNVSLFINKFGVSQTIQEIFQSIGILHTFDGVSPQENIYFERLGIGDITDSKIMSAVAASIDPETFILDPNNFARNYTSVSK